MPNFKTLQRSFAGGEVSPEMYGRIDDVKYQSGAATMRNFIAKPQGPVENRAGFEYVATTKYPASKCRLIPFTFNTIDTMVIEMGEGYFRFHTNGQTLMDGAVPYEVTNSYTEDDLFDIHYVQSADVLTLVHRNYPPAELRRLAADNWELKDIDFVPAIDKPTSAVAAASGVTSYKYAYYYKITSVADDGTTESEPSDVATGATLTITGASKANPGVVTLSAAHNLAVNERVYIASVGGMTQLNNQYYLVNTVPTTTTITLKTEAGVPVNTSSYSTYTSGGTLQMQFVKGNLLETGAINTVSWGAVSGAQSYRVYKRSGGVYGYIGQSSEPTFIDDNIAADLSTTPPIIEDPFTVNGQIESVAVSSGGSGYGTNLGGIYSITVKSSAAYNYVTSISVTDTYGSGCTVDYTLRELSPGVWAIDTITVLTPGTGYVNPQIVVTGSLYAKTNTFIFSKYPNQVTLKVTDPSGQGALLVPVISGGVITEVTVANPGSNYVAPVVSVDYAGGGTGAAFETPVINNLVDYPGAVSYYEQRRCFAGTTKQPQNIWMTKSGTESNMSYSLPIRDDDRISVRVAAREANTIRHIVPLSSLILLTSAAEWRVSSVNSDAITPTSISVKPQSYVGANNVQPVIVNNNMLYVAARGGHVREATYNWQANGFITGDLSLRSAHLFDNYNIIDMAYTKAPEPIVWFISDTGKLLGLAYIPEQQIGAWHQHDTDGTFESCTVVAEGNEDVLYVVVRRTINGASKRYVERMASRQFADKEDAFFVDCGLTYSGPPADTISGLTHLEGKTVSILADGAVHPQRVVTSGSIQMDVEASKVHVGLPIEADLETLPLAMQIDGAFGQGRYKNVNKAWLRVFRSSGIFVGPNADNLVEAKQRTTEPYGSAPELKSEEIQIMLTPSWADSGSVFVRQSDPLPLTIASLTLEVAVGG